MKLVSVSGENFGCLRHFELPLGNQGLTLIIGENRKTTGARSNGAGKTTLYKAVTWGLFGKTIDGDGFDRIIRRGADSAIVEVKLENGDGEWRNIRSRSKGSPKHEVLGPDARPLVQKKDDLQAILQRMLGFDFDTFRNTVLFGQGDINRFASPRLGDVERKQILHRILRTERLRTAEEVARKKAGELKKSGIKIESDVARLEGQKAEHNVDAIQKTHDAWETERTNRYNEAVEEARRNLREAKSSTKERADVEAHEEAQRELVAKIEVAEAKEKRLAKMREDIAPAIARQAKAAAKEEAAETAMVRALEERDALAGNACSLCDSPLAGKAAAESAAAKVKKLRAAYTAAEGAFHTAVAERTEADHELAKLRADEKALKSVVQTIPVLRRDLEATRAELASARESKKSAEQFKRLTQDAIARGKAIEAEVNPHADSLAAAETRVAVLESELAEQTGKLNAVRTDAAYFDFWVRGFGGQGIPSFVLESALPYVTERANHYLGILSDGDIQIEVCALSKTSGGEERDKIDMRLMIEGLDDVTPSGGQERKIEIAADLGLMDLAAREIGRPPLLMFDEVLDGLDDEGKDRVIRLLHELRGRFDSIFVITHEADLSEAFEHIVRVTKHEDGSSVVEVVS